MKKSTAYHGLTAFSTSGAIRMPRTPSTAMRVNQTAMTGPNSPPIRAVPRFCRAKNAVSTTAAIGQTQSAHRRRGQRDPSIAPSTEIAGVITPSP